MTTAVHMRGADTLCRTLDRAADDFADLTPTHRKVADDILARARPATPRRTGRLASSQRTVATPTRAGVEATAPYAAFVHYGTHTQAAQPWLTDAMEKSRPVWLPHYERDAQTILNRIEGI